ncbi:cytochrome P450 4c21 [Plutella xylostella]|uniref:cytochrome P450 4c21 n=1 Tax=Plutella xylostella TaxID=51655 RepID=UPI002032481C|nr:cytochrome P450 4c21 [Plutella xylostella]
MIGPILLCGLCVCFYLLLLVRRWRYERLTSKIPTIPGDLPFIRHAHLLIGDSENLQKFIEDNSNKANKLGGIIKVWIGRRQHFLVTDPDVALTLMNACLNKAYFYEFASSWIGQGIFTAKADTWKAHRKLLNPTFSQHVLVGYLQVFNSRARGLVSSLAAEVGRGEFDSFPYLAGYTLETICNTVMGLPEDTRSSIIDQQFVSAADTMLNLLIHRVQRVWYHWEWVYGWSAMKREEDRAAKVLKTASYDVLQKRKASKFNSPKDEIKNVGSRQQSFLDLLLDYNSSGLLSDQQVLEEVNTMIVAGYDTVATALHFCLILLGSYPAVQEQVYEELQRVFGDSDRDVSKCDLGSLVHLEAVVKEAGRLLPAGAALARDVHHDVVFGLGSKFAPCGGRSDRDVSKCDLGSLVHLEAVVKEAGRLLPAGAALARDVHQDVAFDNYTIPAGSSFVLSLWGLNRHPCWGADAHEFRPSRWLEPDGVPKHPAAYANFGVGRRSCIGKTYAIMAMKTTLAHLLRRYRVTSDHTRLRLKCDLLTKHVAGHHISLELR